MTENEIGIVIHPWKLDAIKIALHRKGQTLERALERALEKFYEETVPRKEREEIEARILAEEASEQTENEAERFCVIRFHDRNEDFYFTASGDENFYTAASVYKNSLKEDVEKYTLDSLATNFIYRRTLDKLTYAVLCKAQSNDKRIARVIEFDFENEELFIRENTDPSLRRYRMTDLETAAEIAEEVPGISDATRQSIFEKAMAGKELSCSSTAEPVNAEEDSTLKIGGI
jgi:hypothetical protein